MKIKPLKFVASSLDDLRNFPDEARRAAGFELHAIQSGLEPSDWKPMQVVGSGIVDKILIWLANVTSKLEDNL